MVTEEPWYLEHFAVPNGRTDRLLGKGQIDGRAAFRYILGIGVGYRALLRLQYIVVCLDAFGKLLARRTRFRLLIAVPVLVMVVEVSKKNAMAGI